MRAAEPFTPWRRATVNPHALTLKSMVYSDKRLLYPMKRVDFDPNGERNPQNRGISGYERISWDEALDIVANEIKRQKREHGPGAMAIYHSSHHQWGNVGYYLSALPRFGNLIGFTRVHLNPDSWEGWYWGAQHHFGNSLRVGRAGHLRHGRGLPQGMRDDRLLVERSRRPPAAPMPAPRARSGGCGRRSSASSSCTSIRTARRRRSFSAAAGSRSARAPMRRSRSRSCTSGCARACTTRSTSRSARRASTRGATTCSARTTAFPRRPNGRKRKPACPAHVVRALARAWGRQEDLPRARAGQAPGLGGACRTATGAQWARSMILMMAMQGWGKPGINFGNLQGSTPLDFTFYFPGYAEGGISGDLVWTASAISNYERMPHVLTMNPVKQMIPRQRFPEAIIEGKCKGYLWDGSSLEAQFAPFEYPHARPFARAHALPLRRLVVRHHRQLAPLHRGLPAPVARVRRQPVDLVRGRGEVRRRDPAGLHVVRALGHRRVGGRGRLRPSRAGPAQPSRWSCCSTSASSRSASRSPTTRSSSRSCTAWGWARCTRKAAASSTGRSACSIPPICRST